RYGLYPVRTGRLNRKFHPKAYLLLKQDEALLLIASANLTPSGFQTNLEIVDELKITEDGSGDSRAFHQFGQMLRSLARLGTYAPNNLIGELKSITDSLDRRLSNDLAGPHLLHSVDEPLLDQVLRLAPPSDVQEIVAVSPFFDQGSKAILAFATA